MLYRSMLPTLRVATPCDVEWHRMTGDDRVRACGQCKKNVYNLSNMTRAEAEAVIIEKEGDLCVRYYQRADGTILLKDCEVGVAKKRKRRFVAAAIATMIAGGNWLAYKMTRSKPVEKLEPPKAAIVMPVAVTPVASEPIIRPHEPTQGVPPVEWTEDVKRKVSKRHRHR